MTEQAKATRTILSTAEKIAKYEALLVDLRAKRAEEVAAENAAAALASVGAGYVVSFELGRGEAKRTLSGVVLGRGLINDKDSVKVQVGEGFDAQVYSVAVASIASAANPNAEPVEEAPAAEGEQSADDLLNGVQIG